MYTKLTLSRVQLFTAPVFEDHRDWNTAKKLWNRLKLHRLELRISACSCSLPASFSLYQVCSYVDLLVRMLRQCGTLWNRRVGHFQYIHHCYNHRIMGTDSSSFSKTRSRISSMFCVRCSTLYVRWGVRMNQFRLNLCPQLNFGFASWIFPYTFRDRGQFPLASLRVVVTRSQLNRRSIKQASMCSRPNKPTCVMCYSYNEYSSQFRRLP